MTTEGATTPMYRRPRTTQRPDRSTITTLRDARADLATVAERLRTSDTGEARMAARLAELARMLVNVETELARTGHR